MTTLVTLNDRELATVLASLRELQAVLHESGEVPQDLADHFEECECLSEQELDSLCERLNERNSPHCVLRQMPDDAVVFFAASRDEAERIKDELVAEALADDMEALEDADEEDCEADAEGSVFIHGLGVWY